MLDIVLEIVSSGTTGRSRLILQAEIKNKGCHRIKDIAGLQLVTSEKVLDIVPETVSSGTTGKTRAYNRLKQNTRVVRA